MELILYVVGVLFLVLAIDIPLGRNNLEHYQPQTLKSRLVNLVIGIVLIAVAYLLF